MNAGTVPGRVTIHYDQELVTDMQKRVQVLGNKTFVTSRVALAVGKCELDYELPYWMSKTSITRSKMCWRQNIWGWQEHITITFKVKLTADRIHWVHNILYSCLLTEILKKTLILPVLWIWKGFRGEYLDLRDKQCNNYTAKNVIIRTRDKILLWWSNQGDREERGI